MRPQLKPVWGVAGAGPACVRTQRMSPPSSTIRHTGVTSFAFLRFPPQPCSQLPAQRILVWQAEHRLEKQPLSKAIFSFSTLPEEDKSKSQS